MKYLFLLCIASVVLSTVSATYEDLEKASGFDPISYGSQSAKDVRSIGRSYAYQLMKKQEFSVYMDDLAAVLNSDDQVTAAQTYAKTYVGHVGVVGVGIVLALALFVGFLLCWCCMLCCNKSQKQTSTMAMWRMIWGAVLIVFLAASVAGLLIFALSGSELTKLEGASTDTIETLGGDLEQFLDETNSQIETLKTDHIETLFGTLDPLFGTAVSNSATKIKAIDTPSNVDTEITNIVTALNNLNTVVVGASSKVDTIYTNVVTLETDITSINGNIKICKDVFQDCQDGGGDCYTQAGIDSTIFDNPFDVATLKKDDLKSIKDELDNVKVFGSPPQTLDWWATEVQKEWDGLDTTITTEAQSAQTDFEQMLADAKKQFTDMLNDDVQAKLTDLQNDIATEKDSYKAQVSATIKYIKDKTLLKEADETDVPQSIVDMFESVDMYALFAVFVVVCVLIGLMALTVIIGLLCTVLGCCKADNDVPPTERSTGCCGNLLMCTSYCSVVLCGISTLIAAILVTVVMLEEGTCKDYNDGKLLDSINTITNDLGTELDLNKMVGDLLDLEDPFDLSDFMEQCKKSKTLFTALNLEKDSQLMGFSIQSIQDEVDQQIDDLDAASLVAGLTIEVEFISATDKAALETSKTDLSSQWNTQDLQDVKDKLDEDLVPNDLAAIPGKIDTAIANTNGNDPYDMASCKTAVEAIITTNDKAGGVTDTVAAIKTPLDALLTDSPDPPTAAGTEIDNLIAALTDVENSLTDAAIKAILKTEIETVLNSAKSSVNDFMDYLYGQFQTTILNCQPLSSTYQTVMNFGCDGIFIHLTLVYCGLSLIGISLLFYMCVSRCLARYFIKFSRLHPDDEDMADNGWGPYPGHYAQTKL